MGDVESAFGALGYSNVRIYIRTGNVVFDTAVKPGPELIHSIEARLRDDLGHDIAVLLRAPNDLAELVAGNPFLTKGADPSRLHVTFLADTPEAAMVAKIDPEVALPDEFQVVGADVYLHCPEGYGRSKLANAFWERKLRTAATTRNWNTVTKLLELCTSS